MPLNKNKQTKLKVSGYVKHVFALYSNDYDISLSTNTKISFG